MKLLQRPHVSTLLCAVGIMIVLLLLYRVTLGR